MDARVTLLEKQIEEMQKQIKQADEKIAYTETEKKKIIKVILTNTELQLNSYNFI